MAARAAQAKAAPTGLAVANPAANLPKAAVDQVTIVLPRPQGLLGITIMAPWAHMICSNMAKIILMVRMMISMILMTMTIHLIQGKTALLFRNIG